MVRTRLQRRQERREKKERRFGCPSEEDDSSSASCKRNCRRSSRGESALSTLASRIVKGDKVVFVTGAGLSVASGIRPFRTTPKHQTGQRRAAAPAGMWNSVIWTTATRESFRRNPLAWYNDFFLPHFHGQHCPNWGHRALQELLELFENVCQITQNIDGLQPPSPRLIECHGRVGLYKCLIDEEDSSDDESDEDQDDEADDSSGQRVELGHRGKSRRSREQFESPDQCPYQYLQPLEASQLEPSKTRNQLILSNNSQSRIESVPRCPVCDRTAMPLALMFDEGYHSHSFYQFETAEEWLANADVLVFCGTSFSVRITSVALKQAQSANLEVYNLNKLDLLDPARLNVSNIVGDLEETLPKLIRECRKQMSARDQSNEKETKR